MRTHWSLQIFTQIVMLLLKNLTFLRHLFKDDFEDPKLMQWSSRKNQEINILARKNAWTSVTGPEPLCAIKNCTRRKEFLEKERYETKHFSRIFSRRLTPQIFFKTLKLADLVQKVSRSRWKPSAIIHRLFHTISAPVMLSLGSSYKSCSRENRKKLLFT